jgi:hypothetical protein
VACRVIRDTYGTLYQIPSAKTVKTPDRRLRDGSPHVDVWWDRDHTDKAHETLMIRQENMENRADVVSLTLGQVYDMIHALGWAVMKP